ncbi:MAG: CPBP family intramembrane metalloprotease [Oscillospiraceae bacterium]|nr:CPBP family intramembrane metalloprotease [Oscillospiraceae bacterium]
MEKRALRALSARVGCALLVVCALQLGLSFAAARLWGAMDESLWFVLVTALSGLTLLAGALAGRKLLGTETRGNASPARNRASLPECLPLLPAGAALCMAGNAVGALVENVAGRAGVEFHGGVEPPRSQSLPLFLLTLLAVSVLPAVAEEWLLRGVILPPLRRFGDGFAVTCTAALFALLHQNMEQAPMAFVAGLALGWVYIRSGRLIVPVAVHLWNNAAATLLSVLPEGAASLYALALAILGVLCLFMLCLRRREPRRVICEMPAYRRASYFFFGSLAMALALGYFVVVIAMNTAAG